MKLGLFDYNLPKELIAEKPASPRDSARLFVFNRLNTKCVHDKFYNVDRYLQKGDILVLNNTKVIPARLIGRRTIPAVIASKAKQSRQLGRKFKILLLEKKKPDIWTALIDGKGRREGLLICFGTDNILDHNLCGRTSYGRRKYLKKTCLQGKIIRKLGNGIWEIKFNQSGKKLENLIFELGQMPLSPYIKQENKKTQKHKNKLWYQTVYAKYSGSVAAPTAGFHFTNRLIKKLKRKGIQIEYITLHVGLGTFLPVKAENIKKHKMHGEFAVVSEMVAKRLNKAKRDNKKIIAIGTTAARTLEAFTKNKEIQSGSKHVDIFIYPPYRFKFVGALITNFHLPKSTLLMMIAAFLSERNLKGIKTAKDLYRKAIKKKYRFFSYGDAMLIQ